MPVHSQTDFRPLTKASAKLPGALHGLAPGSEIAISSKSLSGQTVLIKLSHPLAPHQPSFQVLWILESERRRFALIEEVSLIEPDDLPEPSVQALVEIHDGNTIAVIDELEYARLLPSLKEGILNRRVLSAEDWNKSKADDLRKAFEIA